MARSISRKIKDASDQLTELQDLLDDIANDLVNRRSDSFGSDQFADFDKVVFVEIAKRFAEDEFNKGTTLEVARDRVANFARIESGQNIDDRGLYRTAATVVEYVYSKGE